MIKKIFFAFLLWSVCGIALAQNQPAYKEFPTLPPVNILLSDSSTYFTTSKIPKNKPLLLILFSPDCDHCQHETEEIIKNINSFKNITIVMSTTQPFAKMKAFEKTYKLKNYKNITVGRDYTYKLPGFFGIKNLPFLAFYDKNGKLIDVFEGALPIDKVLQKFK